MNAPTDLHALTAAMAAGDVRRIADVLFPPDRIPYASVEIIRASVLRVVCGWCGVVLTEGTALEPVSHGMCASCVAAFGARLDGGR